MAGDTPADRVRERIRQWLALTGLGQRDFARQVGKSQVWLQKILKEGPKPNDVRLRDLDAIARAMRTSASELVRASDDRYSMELTPTEVRVLEQLRQNPTTFQGLTLLLKGSGHQGKGRTPVGGRAPAMPKADLKLR
jgi:transcriptional regulator with XRE-family HTH domain